MRTALVSILVLAMVSCGGAPPPEHVAETGPMKPAGPAGHVLAVSDAVVADVFARYPERAAQLRVPGLEYDALPDDSLEGVAARDARHDAWLGELRTVDPHSLEGTKAGLAWGIAYEYLESQRRLRVCKLELWNVAQAINGWQIRFTNLAEAQPVGTPALREQALTRFGALPAYVDAHVRSLREGIRLGFTAPKNDVRLVIEQLGKLGAGAPEASPFSSPARRDGDPAFKEKFVALVRDRVAPAVAHYREFLEREYLPAARDTIGVSSNPDGPACYRAAIRASTTLELAPEEVHAKGLARLGELETEMATLSRVKFGGTPVPELLARMRDDPAYRYKSREDVMAQAAAAIERAKKAMPTAFHLMPRANVVLEPIPAFQEKTASAHYLAAALDGSRPATYRVRLYQPEQQSRIAGETTAFHETIPGHHLQVGIANEREELPAIARFLFNSGYGEGWGLYSERLADELGLFSGDADRLGMLSAAAWRAVRLVVDTGIHALGWDRQRALETLLAHTALSPDQAAAEIDRYIAWPGQATAYMIGYMEIMALRGKAETVLGAGFELREFHDRVLEQGSVPLPMLRRHVERWIEDRRAKLATPAP